MTSSPLTTQWIGAHPDNFTYGRGGNKVNGIVIHHAVTTNIWSMDATFAKAGYYGSAHYGVWGGDIHQYVDEDNTAYHCSNWWGNQNTIGIECVNSSLGGDYPVADDTLETVCQLVADIARRYGLGRLYLNPDEDCPKLSGHKDWQGAATACFPFGTEVLTKDGFWAIEDITKEDEVAQWDPDTQEITFAKPLDIVEPYAAKVVKVRDTEATENHQMFDISNGKPVKYEWGSKNRFKFPTDANYKAKGLDLTDDEVEYLLWVQADGSYMRDGSCYYGVEFHLKKPRKIERVIGLLDDLGKEFVVTAQSDGTAKIRVYGKEEVLWCEKYLSGKKLTWEWIELSDSQYERFREAIVLADGCAANSSYSSNFQQNIDIVQAILQLHGQPSHVYYGGGQPRLFFANHTYWTDTRYGREESNAMVTCLEMPKGSVIIRQNGRIQIVGNCPGPYLYARLQYICDRANEINYPPEPVPEPTPAIVWVDVPETTLKIREGGTDLTNLDNGQPIKHLDGDFTFVQKTEDGQWVRTKYSKEKGINNGVLYSDLIRPQPEPTPEPEPEPQPDPQPEPTPEPEPTDDTPNWFIRFIHALGEFFVNLFVKKEK